MTAGTLNLVELGEVVATRDKLTVPIWTAWRPRLAALLPSKATVGNHMGRVLRACQGRGEGFLMATVIVCRGRDGHGVGEPYGPPADPWDAR